MSGWRIAAVFVCLCSLFISTEALAETPRIAVFNYSDSLAIEVDCTELFTPHRVELLQNGYPLSFALKVSLSQDKKLWFDSHIAKASARFRVVYRKWDNRYSCELNDFAGYTTSETYESLDDILHELEERLFATFAMISELDESTRYYFNVNVEYRNMTFDDVKSADRWLRSNRHEKQLDSNGTDKSSFGEKVLGLLWNIASVNVEKDESATQRFWLSELRRVR